MKVIGLMVDFLKIVKLWCLSTEFYGVWQEVEKNVNDGQLNMFTIVL